MMYGWIHEDGLTPICETCNWGFHLHPSRTTIKNQETVIQSSLTAVL